jgi:hypothetical protein
MISLFFAGYKKDINVEFSLMSGTSFSSGWRTLSKISESKALLESTTLPPAAM